MTNEDKKLKFGANEDHDYIEESNETPSFWERITGKYNKGEPIEHKALPERTYMNPPDIKPVQPADNKTAIPLTSPFASSFNTITKDTVIEGDFITESELKFSGTLKGKLKSKHDITINGNVTGNVTGKDVHLTGGVVRGNINATGNVSLDGKSMVIGDIKGIDCIIDGKVKGSIKSEGTVGLQNNAIVHGNITAVNFDAHKGAVINGHVCIICNNQKESEIFALPNKQNDTQPKKDKSPDNDGEPKQNDNQQPKPNEQDTQKKP